MSPERTVEQDVRTTDVGGGRRIAFQTFGDPRGRPVFFFHGSPASRLEGEFLDAPAAAHHIRLIAVDRPGMGCSDPQPSRRLVDWPSDISAVARELHLDRFLVMGFSTGALYVYACAKAMPDRLDGAVIVSGTGPPSLMRGFNAGWLTLMAARALPPAGRWMFGSIARRAEADPVGFIPPGLAQVDRDVLKDGEPRRRFLSSFLEAYRGGSGGVVDDQILVARHWGFDLDEVETSVSLWHGTEDQTVPSRVAVTVAQSLRHGRLNLQDGEGHVSLLVNHGDRILAGMAAEVASFG
jgi:pimeloyl-ACP methyl ester carboxylesterase